MEKYSFSRVCNEIRYFIPGNICHKVYKQVLMLPQTDMEVEINKVSQQYQNIIDSQIKEELNEIIR